MKKIILMIEFYLSVISKLQYFAIIAHQFFIFKNFSLQRDYFQLLLKRLEKNIIRYLLGIQNVSFKRCTIELVHSINFEECTKSIAT